MVLPGVLGVSPNKPGMDMLSPFWGSAYTFPMLAMILHPLTASGEISDSSP